MEKVENTKKPEQISITFPTKNVGEEFKSKDGRILTTIRFKQENGEWGRMVVSPNQIRKDSRSERFSFMYMPKEGSHSVETSVKTDRVDENGKTIYDNVRESVPNIKIKEQEESYRVAITFPNKNIQKSFTSKKGEGPDEYLCSAWRKQVG